jgi:hypothetical protein
MRQSATRELFDYWNTLRGEREAPDRAEIDPAAIRNVLADTFMLEVDDEHEFPIRLSGSRVNALFCAEQKRRAFVDLWSGHEARNIASILATVADATCPLIAGAVAAPKGYNELELELLFLPLRHGGEVNARILGTLAMARKPPWLGLLPTETLTLRWLRTVGESAATYGAEPDIDLLQSDKAMPASEGGFERRGHLRVFRGGR